MGSTALVFRLIHDDNCPLYQTGDTFQLSGNAVLLKFENEKTFVSTAVVRFPGTKKSCRTLIGDLTNILILYENIDQIPPLEVTCSGCTGSARVEYKREKVIQSSKLEKMPHRKLDIISHLLRKYPIFRSLDDDDIEEILPLLRLKKIPKGSTIITYGDPARNLFIIVSGVADAYDGSGLHLSSMRKGDVFGEMSLVSGNAVSATVKATEAVSVVFISGQDFKHVFDKYPSVQTYLIRVLSKRLIHSNVVRAEEISSGMSGQLSELPVAELLQSLNIAQKTGVLNLTFSQGTADLFLRDGNLIKAVFNGRQGEEAIYAALKEKEGRFIFNAGLPDDLKDTPIIGSMMKILLDTSRIIDEENMGE